MLLDAFLAKHEKVVLQFSAGKDSAACLKLLRPYIDKVLVLWGNPGAEYPETREYMERIRASVPHFREVRGTQPQSLIEYGYPADSVPFAGTRLGKIARGEAAPLITSVEQCCGENLWLPVSIAIHNSGATGVIRGEKSLDKLKSIAYTDDRFFFPLYHWTDAEVIHFLGSDIPASYDRGLTSSLDCMTCTAYLDHNPGRLADLKKVNPAAHAEILPVITWLRKEAIKTLTDLESA